MESFASSELSVGILPIPEFDGLNETVARDLDALGKFRSVSPASSRREPGHDALLGFVPLTRKHLLLEAHLYSGYSGKLLATFYPKVPFNAPAGINAGYVARGLLELLAAGGPIHRSVLSEKVRHDEQQAARRPEPAAAPAGGVSAADIERIVKAAVAGAAPEKAPAAAPRSDVDSPRGRAPERPDDYALVVGIEKYSDLPEARFAERDAEAVKEHLIALGFPSRNVVHLSSDKAGRASLVKYLELWLPKNVGENSRVFFYFSGHGAPDVESGEAYLLPWDGDAAFLSATGYPLKSLYEKLAALKAREVVAVLDACFSGAGGRSVLAKGARPLVTALKAPAVPARITAFAAASASEITSSLEEQGHGAFTYYFLKGLSGEAAGAGGRVTARSLYDYLKPKVADAARRQNRDQTPVLHGADGAVLAGR